MGSAERRRRRAPLCLLLASLALLSRATTGVAEARRAERSTARVVQTVEGYDWWLPSYVRITPYSGYITGGEWAEERRRQKRFQDGHIHFAGHSAVLWREFNPAEDEYNWSLLEGRFGPRRGAHARGPVGSTTLSGRRGIVFYVRSYQKKHLPDWVVEKGKIKFLPNGAVAAWEPGCGYQKYFGKMIVAIGRRYKNHPRLIAVDMRGLDRLYGEWCFRGGTQDLKYAETETGLTPETFRAWGLQYVDDFVEAFKGYERKPVWQNGENTFIPSRGTKHDYGPASRAIWRHAYEKGCGGRDGMPTVWLRYLDEGHGSRITKEGYLEFNDDLLPVRTGAMWYTENTEYFNDNERWKKGLERFGGEKDHRMRWFITTMRVLQMRRNWQWVRRKVIAQLDALDPPFLRWVDYSMGKNPRTSPDAWSWLREGYRAKWAGHRPVKNFERWLLQRDVGPDGLTVPAAEVDISMLKYNYASGKGHEFHARRTDRRRSSAYICFRADPKFITGGPHRLLLKVTYLDGPATKWCVEYAGRRGASRSQTVETTGSGKWRTVTFEIRDMRFVGAFRNKMDFRIASLGPGDVTVKLVRLVKPEPTGLRHAGAASAAQAGRHSNRR